MQTFGQDVQELHRRCDEGRQGGPSWGCPQVEPRPGDARVDPIWYGEDSDSSAQPCRRQDTGYSAIRD